MLDHSSHFKGTCHAKNKQVYHKNQEYDCLQTVKTSLKDMMQCTKDQSQQNPRIWLSARHYEMV